eukprot:635110-Amphidinium_carterae.2
MEDDQDEGQLGVRRSAIPGESEQEGQAGHRGEAQRKKGKQRVIQRAVTEQSEWLASPEQKDRDVSRQVIEEVVQGGMASSDRGWQPEQAREGRLWQRHIRMILAVAGR